MALSNADKAVVERWSGTVKDSQVASVEERIARLGGPEFAALEILSITLADMRKLASRVQAGDDRVDHTANMRADALGASISDLVGYIGSSGLTVSSAAQGLVDGASGESVSATRSIPIEARNGRRG